MNKTQVECKQCDYENPVHKGRARWHCPKCDRDYSLEYLLLYEATHPELSKTISNIQTK